jgi:hypothetical protein
VVRKHLGEKVSGLLLIMEDNVKLDRKEVYSEEVGRGDSRSCHAHFASSDF